MSAKIVLCFGADPCAPIVGVRQAARSGKYHEDDDDDEEEEEEEEEEEDEEAAYGEAAYAEQVPLPPSCSRLCCPSERACARPRQLWAL